MIWEFGVTKRLPGAPAAVAREQVEAMEVPAEEFVVVKNAQREEAGK